MKERKVKTKTNSSLHFFFSNLRKIFLENEIYIFELVTNILKLSFREMKEKNSRLFFHM